MEDNWKEIPGFEGLYKINTKGEVYSLLTNKLLSQNISNGYYKVKIKLNNSDEYKNYSIHRLVAITFIPNDDPEHKTFINHKNEIKTDNRVENLEWCTPKYNSNYGTGKNKMKESLLKFYKTNAGKELKEKLRKMHTGLKQSKETVEKRAIKLRETDSNMTYEEKREKYMNDEKAKRHSEYMKDRMKELSKEERDKLYSRKLSEMEMLNMLFSRDYGVKFRDLVFNMIYNMDSKMYNIGDEYCTFDDSELIFPLVKARSK